MFTILNFNTTMYDLSQHEKTLNDSFQIIKQYFDESADAINENRLQHELNVHLTLTSISLKNLGRDYSQTIDSIFSSKANPLHLRIMSPRPLSREQMSTMAHLPLGMTYPITPQLENIPELTQV